jgi:hypothetical protein
MPLLPDDYHAAFETWPPKFGPDRGRFGYKQVFLTNREGDDVTVPLSGLHENGWWIGVRVCATDTKGPAASDLGVQGPLEDAELMMGIGDNEWTQQTGEWHKLVPIPWSSTDKTLSISLSAPVYDSIVYSVRLCFYYTR